jgi:hypothetical protein
MKFEQCERALLCLKVPGIRPPVLLMSSFNMMSMEHWWNDTDRGKLKYWERNIIQRWW